MKRRAPLTRLAEFTLGLAEGKTRGLATLSPAGRGNSRAARQDSADAIAVCRRAGRVGLRRSRLRARRLAACRAADRAGRLRAGTALLWLAWDGERILAAAVTELAHEDCAKDRAKVCTIVACAGEDFARFGHLIAGLEAHARAEGCARMRICGRRGWQRRLPGYALARVVIEKRL